MNITLDKHSITLATLNINLEEADYQISVEKKLKDYKKRANIKGFRPGMVPMEMVKKMFGKSVLVDEINHLLSHSVNDYIKDNKLAIVGDPLPVRIEENIDWDTQKTFDFAYELGLSGAFEVDFTKIKSIDRFEIKAGSKELEETIGNLKNQFGEQIHGETVEDGDMVFGTFEIGDWKEKSAIPMKAVNDASKPLFIGSKIGDNLNFEIQSVFVDQKSLALATGKKENELADLQGVTDFLIEDITRPGKAEMNQEFFDKVLGKDKVSDEANFKTELLTIIEGNYKRESEYLAKIEAEKSILDSIDIELPNEFLRKWLIEVNQGKFTELEVDRDFEMVIKDLKWSLIKSKIAEMAEIKVEYAEVLEKTKEMVRGQFGFYDNSMDDVIEKVANNYLTEKKDNEGQDRFSQMFNTIYNDKIGSAILERIQSNNKIVDIEEFKTIAENIQKTLTAHNHSHDHDHDHNH